MLLAKGHHRLDQSRIGIRGQKGPTGFTGGDGFSHLLCAGHDLFPGNYLRNLRRSHMSRSNNVHTDYYYIQFFEKVNKFLGEFSMYLLVFPGFGVCRRALV